MRTLILITAMVLASATAQAGDLRGLSTGMTSDTQADRPAPAPSAMRANNDTPATDVPRYSPPPAATTTQNEPSRNTSDTPRYNTRPAPVDPAPATTATTPSTPSRPSIADRDPPRSEPSYHPSPSRMRYRPVRVTQHYGAIRWPRPHLPHPWSRGRIIAALHHYGIYW